MIISLVMFLLWSVYVRTTLSMIKRHVIYYFRTC